MTQNEGTSDMPPTKNKKRHKSFEVVNIDDAEPLDFDLGGETFVCYPEVQGKTILDVMKAAAEGDEDTRGVMMAVSVLDFFKKVMPPEEYERFEKLMEDPKRIVRMEVLSEIMSWLIEEYTDRPTQPSSVS
jgi:hypothetical protein